MAGDSAMRAAFWRGVRKGALLGAVTGSPIAILVLLGSADDLGVLVGLLIFLPILAAGVMGLQRESWR